MVRDRSDIEGMSDDESAFQLPEEVACIMETILRELEEQSSPESKRTLRKKKGGKNIQFGV